jgi:hypothetical protein
MKKHSQHYWWLLLGLAVIVAAIVTGLLFYPSLPQSLKTQVRPGILTPAQQFALAINNLNNGQFPQPLNRLTAGAQCRRWMDEALASSGSLFLTCVNAITPDTVDRDTKLRRCFTDRSERDTEIQDGIVACLGRLPAAGGQAALDTPEPDVVATSEPQPTGPEQGILTY